jgi:hypothetical protein
MNIYDRIINILLESRIEDYLDRLDEARRGTKGLLGRQKVLDRDGNGKLTGKDFKMLRSRKRTDEGNKAVRKYMKSWAGKASSGSSSFTDSAISAKKLARAGKHRKEGRKKAARFEIGQSKKLDKPQLP